MLVLQVVVEAPVVFGRINLKPSHQRRTTITAHRWRWSYGHHLALTGVIWNYSRFVRRLRSRRASRGYVIPSKNLPDLMGQGAIVTRRFRLTLRLINTIRLLWDSRRSTRASGPEGGSQIVRFLSSNAGSWLLYSYQTGCGSLSIRLRYVIEPCLYGLQVEVDGLCWA